MKSLTCIAFLVSGLAMAQGPARERLSAPASSGSGTAGDSTSGVAAGWTADGGATGTILRVESGGGGISTDGGVTICQASNASCASLTGGASSSVTLTGSGGLNLSAVTAINLNASTNRITWGGGNYINQNSNGSLQSTGGYALGSNAIALSATAPTSPAACTSPTITHGTTTSFQADVGSSCSGVSTFAFTVPASTNGFRCDGDNITASATRVLAQSAGWTGTTVTMTNYSRTLGTAADFADGADLVISCVGR